jgi:hypothetical protein
LRRKTPHPSADIAAATFQKGKAKEYDEAVGKRPRVVTLEEKKRLSISPFRKEIQKQTLYCNKRFEEGC